MEGGGGGRTSVCSGTSIVCAAVCVGGVGQVVVRVFGVSGGLIMLSIHSWYFFVRRISKPNPPISHSFFRLLTTRVVVLSIRVLQLVVKLAGTFGAISLLHACPLMYNTIKISC